MSAGISIHLLLLLGPGALFQVSTCLPWVVLWRCLFPVLLVSSSASQHSCLLQICQHCPEEAKACCAWGCAGLCLCLTQPPQDSTSWWAQSVQGSPWLLPWPSNHRQLAFAAPWQVLDWRNPGPPAVLLGAGQDIPFSGAKYSSAASFTIGCFCPVLKSSLVLPLCNPEWLRKGLTWMTMGGWISVILTPRPWWEGIRIWIKS